MTGFWLGEGGMAKPRRGVRAPPLFREVLPGIGGRSRGAEIEGGSWGRPSSALLSF